jgi:hypothetical protein
LKNKKTEGSEEALSTSKEKKITAGKGNKYEGGEGVIGNDKGNKITETIFIGRREFIMLADSGEIISQSLEPQSVSGVGLNTYRVCPPTPYRMWSQLLETWQS